MTRLRAFLSLALVASSVWACREIGPTGPSSVEVPLELRPSFQVDPALFPSGPIDRVRLSALEASSRSPVGSVDESVDPAATEWRLGLLIDLGGSPTLEIVVEAELFSGGVVEWSGRLGPFMVRASETAAARALEIHRGPLGNLDVLGVAIQGAPAQVNVGSTIGLTGVPTLAAGSTTTPTIYWASTNPAVATVSATGSAVTVDALAPGTVDIVATAGNAHDQVTLVVAAVAPPGFTTEWRGTVSTDWHDGANWSTGQVPASNADVYVPAGAAQPTVSATAQVADLELAPGATVTLNNASLVVWGDLRANGSIGGAGTLGLYGTGTTARGTVTTAVGVTGSVSASGSLVAGALVVTGPGALFDVGGQTVLVQTDALVDNGGALRMAAAGGLLDVGDITFSGTSTAGLLTEGVLRVSGDFTAGVHGQSFVATGAHRVVLDGTQTQTICFSHPGTTQQRFQHVSFDNPTTVGSSCAMVATGILEVAQGSVATSSTVSVGGGLVDPSGGLSHGGLTLVGNVSLLPSAIDGPVVVDATVDWPVDATITGDLTVSTGALLHLGTHTLGVTGGMTSNGSLNIPATGGLNLGGILVLGPGSFLHVDGYIDAGGCQDGGATITGTGSHPCGAPGSAKVWAGGGSFADWHTDANWNPPGVPTSADDVQIPAGFPVLSGPAAVKSLVSSTSAAVDLGGFTLTVEGDLDAGYVANGLVDLIGAGALLQGDVPSLRIAANRALSETLQVANDLLLADADLDVNGHILQVDGKLDVVGSNAHYIMDTAGSVAWVVGDITFDGGDHSGLLTEGLLQVQGDFLATARSATSFVASGAHEVRFIGLGPQDVTFPVGAGQRFNDVRIHNGSGVSFASSAVVAGDLTVVSTGRMNVPAGSTVDVLGAITLEAGSIFSVDGVVSSLLGCTNQGAAILGVGTQPCGQSSGAAITWVGGFGQGPTEWGFAANWSPQTVPGRSDQVLIPSTSFAPTLSSNVSIGGIVLASGAVLNLAGWTLDVAGDVFADGGLITGGTVHVTAPASVSGSLPSLRVGAPVLVSIYAIVYGDLTVEELLDFGLAGSMSVTGNLVVQGVNGSIYLHDLDSVLSVQGDALFNGASLAGKLLSGALYLDGDLTASNSVSNQSFTSDGAAVYLAGSQDQTVTFSSGSPAEQSFRDLYIVKQPGSRVTFASPTYVLGVLGTSGATLVQGGTAPLQVSVALNLTQTVFDGLPVRLVTGQSPSQHWLTNVTFTNMPTDVPQLYLLVPGATGEEIAIDGAIFQTPPQQGGFYIDARNTASVGPPLVVRVTNATPATISGPEINQGLNTTIIW